MAALPIAIRRESSPASRLDHRLRDLVAGELARLAGRVPSLTDEQLDTVEASLRHVIDRLVPARARATTCPETLIALFDLETS